MERLNKICSHPLWMESMAQIQEAETDRIFCKHDLVHFLDVARIAHIKNLEQNLGITKEWIYAAALLHDLGRALQYRAGIPHEQASVSLAEKILPDCGFDEEAQTQILRAIGNHRKHQQGEPETLETLLYWADKKSRICMVCPALSECNWSDEKKNWDLTI